VASVVIADHDLDRAGQHEIDEIARLAGLDHDIAPLEAMHARGLRRALESAVGKPLEEFERPECDRGYRHLLHTPSPFPPSEARRPSSAGPAIRGLFHALPQTATDRCHPAMAPIIKRDATVRYNRRSFTEPTNAGSLSCPPVTP